MKAKLKDNWFSPPDNPAEDMGAAGIYQWSIEDVGVYVGKAKVLRKRLRAYPRNVLAMIENRPWHGNSAKEYRTIHKALREAHDAGTLVTVTVLEVCDPRVRTDRERHWIRVRRKEAQQGGPKVLNSN